MDALFLTLFETTVKLLGANDKLRKAAAEIESLRAENAELKRTNARYMTKLDQFHTGYAVPRALSKGVLSPTLEAEDAPSYNELARLHRNQRESIIQLQGDARKLSKIWGVIRA